MVRITAPSLWLPGFSPEPSESPALLIEIEPADSDPVSTDANDFSGELATEPARQRSNWRVVTGAAEAAGTVWISFTDAGTSGDDEHAILQGRPHGCLLAGSECLPGAFLRPLQSAVEVGHPGHGVPPAHLGVGQEQQHPRRVVLARVSQPEARRGSCPVCRRVRPPEFPM